MDEWLSYQDAGERPGISAEAVRQRAMRGLWPRRRSNEGGALVQIPEGVGVRRRTPVEQVDEQPLERLVAAHERHIGDLQADLAAVRSELAEERKAVAEMHAIYQRLVDELIELRKASAPTSARRRSAPPTAPDKAPEPTKTDAAPSGLISRQEFDVEGGMEAIRKRQEARLAARGHHS